MTTRGEINSNFYQIVNVDAVGAPTEVKPEYITGGNVDHANFANVANIANSVAVANVVGIGNIATINLTNSTSNVLYGNGVFAGISAGANANYANFAGNLVVVGNEANVYVNTSNTQIESHTQASNNYTHQYQNSQYWGVYPENDNDGANPAWAWIEAGLPTLNNPHFFIEMKPADTGIEQRWTFDALGNATFPATGTANLGNLAVANFFSGDGGLLSNISGANVGNVANANYANFAGNAYSVDVANVVGIGNIATLNIDGNAGNILYGNGVFSSLPDVGNANSANYANYANFAGVAYSVSGSNVVGNVGNAVHAYFADVANSVTGSNVSGSVAQANYANIANSVAGANVSGYVANATHATIADSANSVAGANVSGSVAQANYANIANSVAGANVSGSVAQSNYANIANSVAGANVSGYVANATHATVADSANAVAGANVSGSVAQSNYANIANSVAGANVSGSVAQSNYANIANSVAVANVVGIGNIATINLNGSSTQVLYGNGVFATLTLPSGSGISNGTSNVNIVVANGNVNTSVGGVANVFVVTTTGANVVGNLDVTANIAGNSVQFRTTTGVTTANVGAMFWDAAEQTVTLGMNNGVQQQIGLENYILVKASSAITDGQVVMYTGNSSGNNVLGAPADVTATGFRPSWVLGIATQNIALNGTGYITTFGQVHGLNTNAYTEGDLLYLSTSTPGAFTITEPTAPNWHIEVGTVVKKSGGAGVVQVLVRVNDKLNNLSDVNTTTPTAGQALIYTSSNTWVNGNPNIANIAYSVSGSNVSGQVGNALVAGTVYTAAQPNITSTGTLTTLNVSSAINAVSFTSNVATGTAPFTVISTTTVANLNVAQANLANTANAVAGANVSGQVGNALVAGTVYTAAQPNITSTGTLTGLNVSSAVNATSFTSNVATGTAPFVVTSTTTVANLNVAQANLANTANAVAGANVSGQVANALVAGTVYTAAQPNITSTGSLTGLTVSNATGVVNFTTTANVTLGSVSNLHISGGTSGYVLSTDGAGTLSWVAGGGGGGGTPGGSNTYVQFNDGGSFGGNASLTFNKTTGTLTTANLTVTTTASPANLVTTKYNEGVIAGGSTGAATITPNAAAGTIYNYTLTGNITLSTLTNAVAGTGMTIILTQDATGNRTLTSTMKFLGGIKTLSTAANAIDIMSVFYDGTTYYASLGKGFA
jgi:hypothetical protein